MAPPLSLRVVPPKGCSGEQTVSVDPDMTGADLRNEVQKCLDIPAETQLLFFQNGSRNSAKLPVDDAATLASQGIEAAATVTVKVNAEKVDRENSKLRQSIAKNGGQSYYYAHANELDLPAELRYVSGGEPIPMAGEAAAAPERPAETPAQVISKYSWADEGEFVCIYIMAEGEAEAIAAAGDGKSGDVVKVTFDARSVELKIGQGGGKTFALVLRDLECEIVPDESKHRVSAGKRVTLKLKKKRENKWMRLTRPK